MLWRVPLRKRVELKLDHATYKVVMPMTYQKSCCLTRWRPLRFQDWVSVSQMSLAMVNAPVRHCISVTVGNVTSDEKSLTGQEESGPTDEAMMALENAD